MNKYSIAEAIIFLAREYGEENMPASEETLRRAIRTKKLAVQEDGDPGRKGYSILEQDLREYAQKRLERAKTRETKTVSAALGGIVMDAAVRSEDSAPIPFPELFVQYIDGEISSTTYYKELFSERMKWEKIMHEKQMMLAQLNAKAVALQNDIQSCQSAIDAYSDGISKYKT